MTERDPTDELIHSMLERRAVQPMPDGLLDDALLAVAMQARRRADRAGGPGGRGALGGTRIVAAVAVLAVVVVAGGVLAGVLPGGPRPGAPSQAVLPSAVSSPSATATLAPTPPAASASATPLPTGAPTATPTHRPPALVLAPDTIASVTEEGDKLRVRSKPSLAGDSKKLEPLLRAGTRLLVVQGPVTADGYDWYQVLPELEPAALFGWVATGRDDKVWIQPVEPACPDALDPAALATWPRLDLLVCFGRQLVSVPAWLDDTRRAPPTGDLCQGAGSACTIDPPWLGNDGVRIAAGPEPRDVVWIDVFVKPSFLDSLLTAPADRQVDVFGYLDAPEASSCTIVNQVTGKAVGPRAHAQTLCRLRFVVTAISHDVATPSAPPSG